jgi:disulfide bond formation protein DsbB
MKIFNRNWPIFLFLVSCVAVGSALIAENIYNVLPCKMCLYQRYPYYFIICISLFFIVFKKLPSKLYNLIIEFLLLVGLFFSIWHVGIEQKIISGLSGCTNAIKKTDSLTILKDQIINQNLITCDEVTWSIMGLSAAAINTLLLVLLLLINTIFIINGYYGKEKNK